MSMRSKGMRRWALLATLMGIVACAVASLAVAPIASAAVSCPNANPVVDENNCHTGTTAWEVNDNSPNLGGFTTKTSVNKGENVVLKIGRNAPTFPSMSVNVAIYRMGYYGGLGGRLITSGNATINNDFTCQPMDATTGKVDCGNWQPTYTVPGSAFPASGVYIAKLTASNGDQNQVVFTVRDDTRQPKSKLLYVLPRTTYEAYNIFGGKSLYFGLQGADTVSGTSRAVKVSFNRPMDRAGGSHDWFFGPDYNLVYWLEREGYDVGYTDDLAVHQNAPEVRQHKAVVISGHSEYWSLEEFNAVKDARDAGVNVASFSANTSYWKVRYEDGGQTLVCYKTVEGGGSSGSGAVSANDWGPDGLQGTADDALGLDGRAGTADDNPQNATTTFRDNGAPPGDPNAPASGRVGPDMPENQLFGIMYVGDNDAAAFPVTVPAGNANGEFATDRIWRNTGISGNATTNIGSTLVNWEWDAVPTQAQYLSRQPSGVKRLSLTNVSVQSDNSWIQDEGRMRLTTPPPGQPGSVGAAKYTAPSGALVFASGTMQWSSGLSEDDDDRIQQATYNIFSDMGVQPDTPDGVTVDPGGSNRPPSGAFTISPDPSKSNQTVTLNASASLDPDGTITKYEWDLNNDGTFERNGGSSPTTTTTFPSEGTRDIRLRVTDNGGATDVAVRTATTIDNQAPTASFTAAPNPAIVGQDVTFNGTASSDPDGTIAKYEWDLDGNGTYETNTGTVKTATRAYTAAGPVTVGLRVTDNGGKTATTTVGLAINQGGLSNYGDAVLDTPGLVSFWRMGESSGTTFADSKGTNTASVFGGVTRGVAGGPAGDTNTAARFNGSDGYARANVNLSTTNKVTVEFWLYTTFANDDRLAMEFTSSYHDNSGGFLIDPDAPDQGGKFAIGLGRGTSRNTAYFTRPTSAAWHHYAIVMDTSAAAVDQIKPYVDGQLQTVVKPETGTGAGNFANSALYFMSRAGQALFGAGDLDEVAVYNRALDAATISEHAASYGMNRRPIARLTSTPAAPRPNQTVNFNASTSSDPDGSIVKYEWDLDGNGSYETNTGSIPTASRSYATEGDVTVRVRVTDNLTGTDTESTTFTVKNNQLPIPSFTATPNPAVVGQSVAFNGAASSDPDGSITKYEWDLDGNGTYETDTGTTTTTQRTYSAASNVAVGLRVTDNGGQTATTTVPLVVRVGGVSAYPDAVLDTPGLQDYWRMGETSGTTFADSKGTSPATAVNGVGLGAPGAVAGDPDKAAHFDGVDDSASANVNLSGTDKVTVEFWLKWNPFAGDDKLAMEFTDNFNVNSGGFLIDPNAPQQQGSFGVGIGSDATRNNAFFDRPTAGEWHHYAFVFDTALPGPDQIKPYVDGAAVPFTKIGGASTSGNFANAKLYFMSRASSALFGPGDLDEVAVYNRALDTGTIAEHAGSFGTNRRPQGRFTATPNPVVPGHSVAFNAATSSDPDGTIVKYQWDLDGDGTFETDTGTNPQVSRTYSTPGSVDVRLRVYDNANGTDVETKTIVVGNNPPTASFTASPNPVLVGNQVAFNASGSSDTDGTITKYEWDLDGNGSYETDTGTTKTTSRSYATAGPVTVGLRVTDDSGATQATMRSVSVVDAQQPPTAAITAAPNPASVGDVVSFDGTGSADADGTITKYEWDLDGNGSYETDTGTVPTATRAYASAGRVPVALRVTDQDGMTGTATVQVDINGTGSSYSQKVLATGGLADYWRLGETAGGTLNDAKGASPATVAGGVSLGAPGAISGDSDTSASFDGLDDSATAAVDLSTTSKLTVEFWLKWDAFAENDQLAMEFTPNFNGTAGGFLVDPNAGGSGKFGVGIGQALSRNTVYFARPTANVWHHYALVFDTTAVAQQQITPYVDGQPISFTKDAYGTGAGPFANSQLYFMSRGGTALFGGGDLDELAIYKRTLTAAEVADHRAAAVNQPPSASFTATPASVPTGSAASFDAAGSADSDGTIAKYEWDLDGNGSYETDTGATTTTSRSYAAAGAVTVGLRVTDNSGDSNTTTRTITVTNRAPTASFTTTPASVPTGSAVSFDASASSDPDGTIAKYEWDLDGNGSYETDTGATTTTSRSYAAAGAVTVGLRVTDNSGDSNTTTRTVTVTNRAPTASFTATPSPAATRQTVTVDASGSTDPDGTLTKYEWDLDGNGSYETNTGTTKTATKVYDTPSTITVGLRVTDNNTATATTTRSLTVQSAYANAILGTTGLRGYWRFADTGTTAADASTSANPGTFTNGPVTTAGLITGEQNAARDFDGSNDYVNLAPNPFGTPSSFSAEAWVRTGSTKGSGGYHYLVTDSSSDFNDGFSLAIDSANHATFVVARTLIFTTRGQATTTVTLAPNTTHHVVGTYDGSRVRVYVDGVERANVSYSTGVSWSGSRDLQLGRKVASSSQSTSYLDGNLDEVALYTAALPAATVQAHYDAGKP